MNSINSIKSQTPSTGDVFYDTNKSRTYVFDGSNWKELVISSKDGEFNKKRMIKINKIFNL